MQSCLVQRHMDELVDRLPKQRDGSIAPHAVFGNHEFQDFGMAQGL
ncbi:hypothetical protein ACFPL7_15385 [Dongia soli]|uniref:Uncharacterized protein n=1 Tax=Dongia soli TaxID=600628 RepID=A0ABU5ED21_9PROT|nr:hypothetical protein [Dongia soli]MDY0883719.1 hypothetical protein [Dongia soli]